ncbi:MAG: aminopeptidase P N-terminal domain-containing protein [Candidatus Cyclobacteriaceae bacterium M3_2C_046]
MRYLPIDKNLFENNRKKFASQLKPNSIAIFNSNDILPTNADGTMPFRQNSDLFHLSGIDQEESVLVIFPDFPDPQFREVLFLRETNEEIAIWEGHKYTREEATQTSGIKNVLWNNQFERTLYTMMAQAENVYLNTNEHLRADVSVETRDARFLKTCKEKFPLHQYQRSAPIMHQLRSVKSPIEIELIQTACKITEQGFRRILRFVEPGVMEYEVEAEYIHEFVRNRSKGFAYQPIVASGFNACVLHYIDNSASCKDGDLLLMDVGAEYANYNGDMTRTIPVNGRYTNRQKEVYNAVLRVQRAAINMLRPGTLIKDYHGEVGKLMESELIGLGLLDKTDVKNQDPEKPLYKKYFMHGTSHHLGLDVHDVGNPYRQVEAGMVFTVEPGIYIREENIGIRLENNIVIEPEGYRDLMADIPIETEEIEALMNEQ